MSSSDDSTRPISVAELLARNGTIGSPPVGGHRRRRRRNSDGVTVAELTGEIPIVAAEEVAEEVDEEVPAEEWATEYVADEDVAGEVVTDEWPAEEPVYAEPVYEEPVYADAVIVESAVEVSAVEVSAVESSETVVVYSSTDETWTDETVADETVADYSVADEIAVIAPDVAETVVYFAEAVSPEVPQEIPDYVHEEVAEDVPAEAPEEVPAVAPPRSADPLPRRRSGPELSHDPRPLRRSSGAEEMAYDPVDESVNLADLVDEDAADAEALRSYLRASQDTLFSGETVADDLARRGVSNDSSAAEAYDEYEERGQAVAMVAGPPAPGRLTRTVWGGVIAVVQSILAVVFGAGLFIGFDQLWRWNNLVALILSVLVVLTLAALVRFVRKTEDIVSTLTAVAVGLLVTLGPLALQST